MKKIKLFNFLKNKRFNKELNSGDNLNTGFNMFYRNKYINSKIKEEMYLNFAISSCFHEILRSFKTLELGVYKNKNGNYVKSNSREARKINKTLNKPNQFMNYSMMCEAYLTSIYFSGNCLIRRIRGVLSDDLYIYTNGFYQVEREQNSLFIKSIRIGDITFTGDTLKDLKIISEFNYKTFLQGVDNGRPKLEPLEPIKQMINGTLAYNISVLTNGGSVGGIYSLGLEDPNDLSEKEKEKIKDDFYSNYSGAGNAGKTLISWLKGTYTPLGTVPKDLDYVNSLKEMQKVVCRLMGVPETLIIGDNSSYNNTLEFKKKLYTELIIPLGKEFCEHLTDLFNDTLAEDEEIYFSTANIKVLQSDMTREIKELVEALTGVCTVNNIIRIINDKYQLELEDLGEQGDIVLTKYNFSLKDVGFDDSDTPNVEVDSDE